ncbi:uncharacterized protein LOC127102694 [Lathyrus oleraceus]|uniref:uncharacterized protein LOC127102694 n=1 Tax=Pisum sativum TaxID=3888 RepID=UPI0021CF79EF|nr:uncharacterized protein LOC127102694 [Pisum sativum]
MELRKLASFVDGLNGFKDCFRSLLSVLSIDAKDGLLYTLVQFYDHVYWCFTFPDYQLLPTMKEYAYILGIPVSDRVESQVIVEAIHLRKSDINSNLTVKGGIRGLTSKFFTEKGFSFANAGSMVAFETMLALLIYGLVLFPNIGHFVEFNAMRIFLIRNLVPTLLDENYFSIHHKTSKEGGTIVYYAPLFDDIAWYSSIYDNVEIIDGCGEFSNVTLLGKEKGELELKDCISLELGEEEIKRI